jgi:hypothetical protein
MGMRYRSVQLVLTQDKHFTQEGIESTQLVYFKKANLPSLPSGFILIWAT